MNLLKAILSGSGFPERKNRRFNFHWILIIFPALLSDTSIYAGDLRAAVVKVDITPSDAKMLAGYGARKSTGIHDRLFHRIVMLDDGNTQFFLVSSDIGKMAPSVYDQAADALKVMGIAPQQFWWTVTHTHSAPEVGPPGLSGIFLPDRYKHAPDSGYTAEIIRKLLDGIKEARLKLAPAHLSVGWAHSQANINRRAIDVDGKASLGLNPEGVTDRRIGLLRLNKADGSPLALIANYPIHGTVLGPESLAISGDAPGIVSEYVEQKTGAPLLFINGAAGNLAPIYSVYNSPAAGHLGQFRVLLGEKILEGNRQLRSETNQVQLTTGMITIETPRKSGMGWPAEMAKYSRMSSSGMPLVLLPIRFLKINEEIAIWSAPLELFCELSNEVRDRSPFPFTFYFGYSNGNLGYLPTAAAWNEGGYEPGVSPFTPAADRDLVESVTAFLQGELRRRSLPGSPVAKITSGLLSDSIVKQESSNPATVMPEPDGSLRLSAEKGKATGPNIKYMPEWRAFGWFTGKDMVEWIVKGNRAGEYKVYMEWSVSDKEAGKPFILQVGDRVLKGKVETTGSWETFRTISIGTVRLRSGNNKIVFRPATDFEKGAILDLREIKLVPLGKKRNVRRINQK